jgi:hypothetical protein
MIVPTDAKVCSAKSNVIERRWDWNTVERPIPVRGGSVSAPNLAYLEAISDNSGE